MIAKRPRRQGFSLIETIIASVILSGSVLALGTVTSIAVREIRVNRHRQVAAGLIDRQLTLIDHVGIDRYLEEGESQGIYDEVEPGYAWRVGTEYYGIDGLYVVTITVTWLEGTRPQQLCAQTMLNGTALTLTVPTEGA